MAENLFIPIPDSISSIELPSTFTMMENGIPHPLCVYAAKQVQDYLQTQTDWKHNFGLEENQVGAIIGKMFGVLIVRNEKNEIGYLAAFSGKMAGTNHLPKFVPPVFDSLYENSFVNLGMQELTNIINEIKKVEEEKKPGFEKQIEILKEKRKNHSTVLQNKIFDHYHFLNHKGEEKSLREIFEKAGYKNPPVGAGECAGPKLLQYAFQNKMQPLAIAEFWWGQSPKSDTWKHGEFYACCKEKCEPILGHMLAAM
jgi:tRNA pseudouridine32 synthase/23S rRNA pseudouridine746 synthase